MKVSLLAVAVFAAIPAVPLLAAQDAMPRGTTRAQYEERVRAQFARRDDNHDGYLSSVELGGWDRVTPADADGDGRLSLDEVVAAQLARFDREDTDHDGVLSPEENLAAMSRSNAESPVDSPD
jgi:Ca2+-binding EF-hand superfamily protein